MPLAVRTFDESYQLARSLLRNYIDGSDVSEGSDYDFTARILAALFTGNQGQAEFLADQIFADTAETDFLERHASRVGGRLPASVSTGFVQITAPSGTDTQPIGSAFTHVSGTAFTSTAGATIALPAWSTKFVVTGSDRYRLFLAPDVTGVVVNDLVTVNGETRAVQGVNGTAGVIDLWEPLAIDPSPGDSVIPTRGAIVLLDADLTGPEGNKPQGDVLTVSSPVGVIEPLARIVRFSGGANLEENDDLKRRIAAHDESPPGNGNASEYRTNARTATPYRVADAAVYPGFRGLGTIDIIPLGPSGARFPTQAMIDAVDVIITDTAPYTDDHLVLFPSLSAYVETSVSVLYETGFEPDFVQTGGGWTIVGATSTPTRLVITQDPLATSDARIGDRILFSARFGGLWQVYEREIAGFGANFVDVTEALPFSATVNPDARDDIYPSGPLGVPVVEALESVYDELGPGIGTAAGSIFERVPLPSDELEPNLRLNALRCAVTVLDGVRDVIIDTVDDTTPADIVPAAQTIVRQGQLTIIFSEP